MKVIIAGGGTGGHIFPAVAIANAIQKHAPGSEILFVGANGKMEMEKVPQAGYKIIGLDIVGFNRSNLLKNITLPFKLWKSNAKAKEILKDFQPDIAIGVGGFASFPVLNAAQKLGIPTLIQEQNSFAGKSNKILSIKAQKICVAYDNMAQFFPKDKIVKTGNPVRAVIADNQVNKTNGCNAFDVHPDQPTLLIVGGSLGAQSVNETIAQNIEKIVALGYQVIWQTGKNYYPQAQQIAASYKNQVKVHDFIKNMEFAYAAADLVISRAGALAIAELCIVGKPVIFVPYPFAAEDHQTSNAMALVNKQAAICVADKELSSKLLPTLTQLVNDTALQVSLAKNIKQEAITDADDRIFGFIDKIVNGNK